MKLLAILAIISATLPASAQPAATFEWKGGLAAGQTLEIRNINGDIQAEQASGSEAEISVQIFGSHPDPNSILIDVVPHDGGILICTLYRGLSSPEYCTPEKSPNLTLSNSDIRVNYTVRMPAGTAFLPRTVNGNLSITLPANYVTASTVNGRIILSAAAPSSAAAVNGTILANVTSTEWTGTSTFSAVNGTLDVQIPVDAHATVRANTVWGFIGNDFGLEVHRALVGSWMSGEINGGGSPLTLSTVNGSVHLRQSGTVDRPHR